MTKSIIIMRPKELWYHVPVCIALVPIWSLLWTIYDKHRNPTTTHRLDLDQTGCSSQSLPSMLVSHCQCDPLSHPVRRWNPLALFYPGTYPFAPRVPNTSCCYISTDNNQIFRPCHLKPQGGNPLIHWNKLQLCGHQQGTCEYPHTRPAPLTLCNA